MYACNKALIIKFMTDEKDVDDTTGFTLEPIGDVNPLDVAATLCATFLQVSSRSGKSFDEAREVLLELFDSMKDVDFSDSENLH